MDRHRPKIGGTFAAWGDSLTAGAGYVPYPATLSALRHADVDNMGIGGENSTQIRTRMVADTTRRGSYTVIWAGRNNFAAPLTVKADIAAMIAALTTTKYAVLSILNGTAEPSGSPAYVTMMQLNADLAALYPTHYVDVRTQLVALANPALPQDVIDQANDVPPSSLRADALHLNTAGYTAVAGIVNTYITGHP